jgi:hypothetical protein
VSSEASQGPDWWQASDGLWYPPELNRDYVARRVPRVSGSAPPAAGDQTAPVPTGVGAPTLTQVRPAPVVAGRPPSASGPFTSLRVVSLVALAVSMVGVFLPWATTDATLSGLGVPARVAGVDVGTGQLLCAVLAAVVLLGWWHLAATSRGTGVAVFTSWLGALALTVYEVVTIIAVPARGVFALDVGVGLSLCAFAALVGAVCSLSDAAQLWSAAGRDGPVVPGVMWIGGVVALAVVAAASFLGYRAAASPVGPIPTVSPGQPGNRGPGPAAGGSSGGTGSTGNSGDAGGSGDSGDSGDSGPSGTTGSSGNTGPGGGLGNSGLGNSGSGLFGNSGSGGLGSDPFGNSGVGNSGL